MKGKPPTTNTLPSDSGVAVCCLRNCFIGWTSVKEPAGPELAGAAAKAGLEREPRMPRAIDARIFSSVRFIRSGDLGSGACTEKRLPPNAGFDEISTPGYVGYCVRAAPVYKVRRMLDRITT